MVDWQIALVLGLVAILLVLFVREVFPIPVTALLGATVLALAGILTTEEALSGFSSEATVAVMAMFVVSAGVQRTGLVESATTVLIRWSGRSHRRQLAALGGTIGPVSAFINNTPVVAVMIPAAFRMAQHAGRSPSKLLMPVSTFAMLGGTLTLIGTSTNILGNTLLPRFGVEEFGFFDFTPVGLVALAIGVVYMVVLGPRLLPDRGRGDLVERFDLKGFLGEYTVGEGAVADGRSLADNGLTWTSGIQVIRIVRDGRRIDAPARTTELRTGDRLLVEGSRERLATVPHDLGLVPVPEAEAPLTLETEDGLATAEALIPPGSPLIGRTLDQIDFRNRHEAIVLAVRHHQRVVIGPLAASRLAAGDVLLVQATAKNLERMREEPDFVITRRREQNGRRKNKRPVALLILVAVVLSISLGWVSVAIGAVAGALAMVLTRCLRMDEFLGSIQWDIFLLLAGIIPLGVALEKTGAAALMANGLVSLGGGLPPLAMLILIFGATTLITEIVSNNASVVLLLPITIAAAVALELDPRPFCLAVIIAASTSMMTPIGYQTNTMVYAPGNYRFSDFFRVGGLLNLILTLAVPVAIAMLYPLR